MSLSLIFYIFLGINVFLTVRLNNERDYLVCEKRH